MEKDPRPLRLRLYKHENICSPVEFRAVTRDEMRDTLQLWLDQRAHPDLSKDFAADGLMYVDWEKWREEIQNDETIPIDVENDFEDYIYVVARGLTPEAWRVGLNAGPQFVPGLWEHCCELAAMSWRAEPSNKCCTILTYEGEDSWSISYYEDEVAAFDICDISHEEYDERWPFPPKQQWGIHREAMKGRKAYAATKAWIAARNAFIDEVVRDL